ncbi:MAG: hypothetical protein K6G12_11290 [Lachnospiraceae bacterium]|nr:hypothetical protein [Lachnospiraceae bacterium]
MNTEKVIRAMQAKGYTVTDESGVLMFSGVFECIDTSIADIKKNLDALGFKGSWGTKGLPKGVKRRDVTSDVSKTVAPISNGDEEDDGDLDEAAGDDLGDGGMTGDDMSGDFTQLSFDF